MVYFSLAHVIICAIISLRKQAADTALRRPAYDFKYG